MTNVMEFHYPKHTSTSAQKKLTPPIAGISPNDPIEVKPGPGKQQK